MSQPAGRPLRVCVLAPGWSGDHELQSARHRVLSALLLHVEVHLVYFGDSVDPDFEALPMEPHRVGSTPTERVSLRRDFLVSRFSKPSGGTTYEHADSFAWPRESLDDILRSESWQAWRTAATLVDEIDPDAVVILDHRDRDVLNSLRQRPELPLVLIPLADAVATPDRVHFDELFLRTSQIVAFTTAEADLLAQRSDRPVAVLDLPITAHTATPHSQDTVASPYVLVWTDAEPEDRLQRTAFAHLIAQANPTEPVLVASRHDAVLWQHGCRRPFREISSDAQRFDLLANAKVVVDLHPGRLYAHDVLQAQGMGIPTIVPSRSRARGYCEKGNGGLWFRNAGEMLWSLTAALDPEMGQVLGRQGRRYVEDHHSSPDRFAEQLLRAVTPEALR